MLSKATTFICTPLNGWNGYKALSNKRHFLLSKVSGGTKTDYRLWNCDWKKSKMQCFDKTFVRFFLKCSSQTVTFDGSQLWAKNKLNVASNIDFNIVENVLL